MTHDFSGYPAEPPEMSPRILRVGSRVVTGATIVFFAGFAFAYIYLKLLNTSGLWNPGHEVSILFGSFVAGIAVLSAVAHRIGSTRLRGDDTTGWQGWAAFTLVGGLAIIALHLWQLETLPFVPTNSAYGSVFVAWTAALIAVELGAMYWLFTLLRGTRVAGAADPYAEASPAHVSHIVASARGFQLFWTMVVVVEVLAFVLLVLVR